MMSCQVVVDDELWSKRELNWYRALAVMFRRRRRDSIGCSSFRVFRVSL